MIAKGSVKAKIKKNENILCLYCFIGGNNHATIEMYIIILNRLLFITSQAITYLSLKILQHKI